jgi:hypothetical protein
MYDDRMNASRASDPSDRLKVALLTIVLNILAVVLFARIPSSDWRTGMMLNLVDNAILIGYAWKSRDKIMEQLLIFGLALGFTELMADAWLVGWTHTLDYSIGGGPMIWRSPLWMPFAWEVVAVQFAVLGMWLTGRFKSAGILWTALVGAVNIPFYEEMALKTHWWKYSKCRMLSNTPYYIILGEFLIVMFIVLLSKKVRLQRWQASVSAGMLAGVAIFICYAFAFWIFEYLI